MTPRDWRIANRYTLGEIAALLELSGPRTWQRYETGEHPAPTEVVEQVRVLTDGVVTPNDFHAVRLSWLNRTSVTAPDPAVEGNAHV